MKTQRNILIAFILNAAFAVFEFFGGIFTGSIAIASDAVHDIGDALSIGLSYFLEKKSKKQPDEKYTYGYGRYSVLGGAITSLILLLGSLLVMYHAVGRLITPMEVNYSGMIVFAVVGVAVNFCAALFTHGEGSLNQRAVNLHMLEDVLGWLVVLVGAVVMRFTDFLWIDPILSVGVAAFILVNAVRNLKEVAELFLEKTPAEVNIEQLREHVTHIDGVMDVHHIHIWSMDGQGSYATMHVVARGDTHRIKEHIREELAEHGIVHATLEMEAEGEHCHEKHCHVEARQASCHHHHH